MSAPSDFPVGATIRIDKGDSLRSASLKLRRAEIIRSRLVFEALVTIFGRERVIETDYFFEKKAPVSVVAKRIWKGGHNIAPVSITIPEGFDNTQIGEAFASRLANFNKGGFLLKAEEQEGYLFPDTYFFFRMADEGAVLLALTENFNKKIKSLEPDIEKSGKAERDIIIMASLIEGEAKGEGDRAIISGILWKRVKIGMPLQADAAPETYKMRGLPERPINNPGKAAILAAIYPENTQYLYYLHDKKGVIHYAKTFAEHNRNIQKYLK
ncbi:endolytic transglycosylase MltG [Candidatus Nomurabacteria bacterium]|nr:endolytic transglycosylase MltG [Candidatus Nomurabacteria bacterium]